jgi:hypothetical protein
MNGLLRKNDAMKNRCWNPKKILVAGFLLQDKKFGEPFQHPETGIRQLVSL